jgi:very-short-patch-repair endonuclease
LNVLSPTERNDASEAADRLTSLLSYVEQVVRLDERAALRLAEHKLPTGQSLIIHQHELISLPGVAHDLQDEDGPVWLRIERLRRGAPPVPPDHLAPWLDVSPDPDREPAVRTFVIIRAPDEERLELIKSGAAREEDSEPSPVTDPTGSRLWDIRLRIEDRPALEDDARQWIEASWLPWALAERPVRRTLSLYQRLFEVAQLAEMGGGDKPFEFVWGIGLSRWRVDIHDIDLPLIERLVEVDIDEAESAAIKIRPRNVTPNVNLRAFDELGLQTVPLAYDSARRTMQALSPEEDISPYLRDTFEPILRACQSQLDSEGVYLPDAINLPADQALPAAGEHLAVSDRWVIFGRKRSESFLLADIDRLKKSIAQAVENDDLPGPCKTLVMGPQASVANQYWEPLTKEVGAIGIGSTSVEAERKLGDLFFPKPFNDEQIEIIRRLEDSDGVVVQGPPGTGKTHTISNVICHCMATGERVLVISHGEPALAVLRDHLPESIRPLAISITTSEREGFRQIESAVRELQSIVDVIRGPDQLRSIRDTEVAITTLRDQLTTADREIEEFAYRQLSPALGGKRAAALAQTVVAAADQYAWFSDRPEVPSNEAAPSDQQMESLRVARARLGTRLEYLGVAFPSLDDLPDGNTVAQWHDDLQRARAYSDAAKQDPSIRIRLDSIDAADAAIVTADALHQVRVIQAAVQETPWVRALAERAVNHAAENEVSDLVRAFMNDAGPIAKERQSFLASPVFLPEGFDAAGPDAVALIDKLAVGGKAFGMFAFKERALKPLTNQIRVQGKTPASSTDWTWVRNYIAWRKKVSALAVRWQPLAEELGAIPFTTPRELADVLDDIRLALVEVPLVLDKVAAGLKSIVPGGLSTQALWFDPVRIGVIEQALRNTAASAKLAAVRVELSRLSLLFRDGSKALGAAARDFLKETVGQEHLSPQQAAAIWTDIRTQIDSIRRHAADFHVVFDVTGELRRAGTVDWAHRLQIEPVTDSVDALMPNDWRAAWDWAIASEYLKRIDDKKRLRHLAEERVRLEAALRKKFEQLVRERTYYELARSMTGPIKAALMMFATAVRRAGKGTGKGAARFRRDAQLAMSQCYGAIPCWIMPSWRVAEQLPGEIGTFDLVIMDEASQSDIRELPSLLRGKKILVVGDDRQVSPTAAFIENAKIDRLEHNYLREQPYKTLLLPGASLYDLAKVMFPDKLVMLREHFRCVEPIIRFSMGFYPESLVPLRVPTSHERLDPPLIDIYVPDGRRTGDKQNRREAEIIVDEIRRTVENPTIARIGSTDRWRTIGVVSLIGAKQAALINRMLLEELGEDIVLRHRIACGDSATFQGNERHIMFVSMIADPQSKTAQTAQQFEQRFNVALSRARDRIVLVRSVQEEELNPLDLKARVIRHFRDPMAGAHAPTGDLETMCDSDFEREVLRRLVAKGYRVTPQVGAQGYRIDLVVEGASGQRLAVECDGDKYHGPDRWADDMRRQRILERVGWRFWRCWASSFTLDPDECMADLFSMLTRIGIEPGYLGHEAAQYTHHVVAEPANQSQLSAPRTSDPSRGRASPGAIAIGDRVALQYLDDRKNLTVTLTRGRDDIVNGLLSATSPLGSELIGRSEDDEIEYTVDGRTRQVLIIKVEQVVSPSETPVAPQQAKPRPPSDHRPSPTTTSARRPSLPNPPQPISAFPRTPRPYVPGEGVSHPTFGPGRVDQIATEEIGGTSIEFIHLSFEDKNMKMKVPVNKIAEQGIRKLARDHAHY